MDELLKIANALMPFVLFVISLLVSIIGWFGRRTFAEMTKQLSAATEKHEALEKEFLKFQAVMPRLYVLKDDHIRHMTILENKIDANRIEMNNVLSSIQNDIKLLLQEQPRG